MAACSTKRSRSVNKSVLICLETNKQSAELRSVGRKLTLQCPSEGFGHNASEYQSWLDTDCRVVWLEESDLQVPLQIQSVAGQNLV